MKNVKSILASLVLIVAFGFNAQAQDSMAKKSMSKDTMAKTVKLEQTKGKFTQESLTLKEGDYVFAISNNNAGVDVGFVLVPKGKDATVAANHIKTAYVTNVVAQGKTETSQTVSLEKGEYVYFCPLNKTPQYTLTVE